VEKVLVVVSDLMMRAKIREAAGAAGLALVVAKSGEAAIERFRADAPSRVVVDLGETRFDAVALVRELKSLAPGERCPVVGFYPHVRGELRDAATSAGCDVILPRSAFVVRLADVLAGRYPS
jgi:CheY-like chemotaxis protein